MLGTVLDIAFASFPRDSCLTPTRACQVTQVQASGPTPAHTLRVGKPEAPGKAHFPSQEAQCCSAGADHCHTELCQDCSNFKRRQTFEFLCEISEFLNASTKTKQKLWVKHIRLQVKYDPRFPCLCSIVISNLSTPGKNKRSYSLLCYVHFRRE